MYHLSAGWERADPALALDLALMVSRPIYEATGRPIFKKPVALLAQWVSRVGQILVLILYLR